MDILKTYYKYKHKLTQKDTGSILFTLRTRLYDSSLAYWLKLFEEAKKDFPNLNSKDIRCIEYGGDTIKGTRGIEFNFLPPKKGSSKTVVIPDGYKDNFIIYPIK